MEELKYHKLNIGCGNIHKEGYINIDIREPADHVFDFTEGSPYPDSSFKLVEADNFLEHLDNDEFLFVMNEVYRILKPRGIFWFKVPDAENWFDGAAGDPTHKRFFTRRSFNYFTQGTPQSVYGAHYGFHLWKLKSLVTDKRFFTCELICTKSQ